MELDFTRNATRRKFCLLTTGVALALCSALPERALGTNWGQKIVKTVGGVTYTAVSGIAEGLNPIAYANASASSAVSKGTFAVRATIKNQLKQIVASSGLVYNEKRGASASVKHSRPKSGYYSQGTLRVGGTSYSIKPTVTCYNLDGEAEHYQVNASGQTYGMLPDTHDTEPPELIAVVGLHGESGYLLFVDYDQAGVNEVLAVYDSEGQNVVDIFSFGAL